MFYNKDKDKLFLVSIKDQVFDIYHNGKLYPQINMINGFYLVHSSHPLYLFFSVFKVNRRCDKDTKETGKVYRKIDDFQNRQKMTFISYSHRDNKDDKKITVLANELKTIGINVFFDEFNFLPGEDWEDVAMNEIERKECIRMISIISQAYLESTSCKKEVLKLLNQRNKKLILYDPEHIINKKTEFYGKLLRLRKVSIVYSRLELFNCFSYSEIDNDLYYVELESNYYIKSNVNLAKKVLIKDCKYNGNKPLIIQKTGKEYFLSTEEENFEYIKDKCDAKAFFINNENKIYKSDCKKKILSYDNMKKILSRKHLIKRLILILISFVITTQAIIYIQLTPPPIDLSYLIILLVAIATLYFELICLYYSYTIRLTQRLKLIDILFAPLLIITFPIIIILSILGKNSRAEKVYNNIMGIEEN